MIGRKVYLNYVNAFYFPLFCASCRWIKNCVVMCGWLYMYVIRSLVVLSFIIWSRGQCYPNKTQTLLSFHQNKWFRAHHRVQTDRNGLVGFLAGIMVTIKKSCLRPDAFHTYIYPFMKFLRALQSSVWQDVTPNKDFGENWWYVYEMPKGDMVWYVVHTVHFNPNINTWIVQSLLESMTYVSSIPVSILHIPYLAGMLSIQYKIMYTFDCNTRIHYRFTKIKNFIIHVKNVFCYWIKTWKQLIEHWILCISVSVLYCKRKRWRSLKLVTCHHQTR